MIMAIYYKNKHFGSICLGLLIITYMRAKYEYFQNQNESKNELKIKDIPVENHSRPEIIPESNYQSLDILKTNDLNNKTDEQRNQKLLLKRLELLSKNNEITPLEKDIVFEIQKSFGLDLDILKTNDFKTISQYTDEGEPSSVGLPIPIDESLLDYNRLVVENKIIDF
jgi:hypothetical protein